MRKTYFLSLLAMLFSCLGMSAQEKLEIKNLSLAEGSEIAGLSQDQQITFNTNMDDAIGYMYVEIIADNNEVIGARTTVYDPNYDNTGNGKPSDTPINKKTPHFTFISPVAYTFYTGKSYRLLFTAFESKEASTGDATPLAEGTVTYKGTSAAYVNSPVKLLSITPDLEDFIITSKENCSVTLNFDAKVTLDKSGTFVNEGYGVTNDLASIVAGDDKETVDGKEYSTSWTLTPQFSDIAEGVDVLMSANAFDMEGRHVTLAAEAAADYATGSDETSFYTFTVKNDYGRKNLVISPSAEDEVSSLASFDINMNDANVANAVSDAVLYQVAADGTKTQVAQAKWSVELNPSGDHNKGTRILLDKAVTKAGKYVLHFPRNYFLFGTDLMADGSATTDIEYTIANDAPDYTFKFTPDTEDKVSKLETVNILFADKSANGRYKYMPVISEDENNPSIAYFFNESKELVGTANIGYGNDWWDVNVALEEAITKPGKYTMVIPNGQLFADASAGMMARPAGTRGGADMEGGNGEEYPAVPMIVKEYTVSAGSIDGVKLTSNVENNATVTEFENIVLTFDGAESLACTNGMAFWKPAKAKGMYLSLTDINGNVATVSPSLDGWEVSQLKADTYTVTLPEGYFLVNGAKWPEIVLTFTYAPTPTGINGVEADGAAAAKQVYTLTGIKVNGKAQKGVFIVNGKKVVLK